MKKKQNVLVIILEWVLAITIGSLLAFSLFRNLFDEQRPLTNADIPQSTIDWFNGLIDGGSDIGGELGPNSSDSLDWQSYGGDEDLLKLEDEYFVIFYSSKDSVVQRKKALVCQRYAHEALPKADLFMKEYPYPAKMNGRKLPIYLGRNMAHYKDISKKIAGYVPGSGTVGFFSFYYGAAGLYTKGIFISPATWETPDLLIDENTKDDELKATLWHEMNHYMFFANWDCFQPSSPSLWFTEGLAEYFSEYYKRLYTVGNHKKYDLKKDFRDGDSEYWVGFSAFLCLEKNFSISKISDVVFQSYKNSVDKALGLAIPNYNLAQWNDDWHTFMENKEYRKYMK